MSDISHVYALVWPPGLLGLYSTAESAKLAGDYWVENESLHRRQDWTPDHRDATVWRSGFCRTNRRGPPDVVLTVCPVPLNTKPSPVAWMDADALAHMRTA